MMKKFDSSDDLAYSQPCLKLHEDHPVLSQAELYPSLLKDAEKPACMLVIPGGGYQNVSHQEGPPVAAWLNSLGISAVVLKYTVGSSIYPMPQQQALFALRYLRHHGERLNIDGQRLGVIGFSAGGHLAASLAHGFDRETWLLDPDGEMGGSSARPDLAILSYAVLSCGKFIHQGSFDHLLGSEHSPQQSLELSWEQRVHPQAPPHFLWHTAADDVVPVENSYLMAMALQERGVEHELHVYPKGSHGLGLVSIGDRRQGRAVHWKSQAETWLLSKDF
jgi:acetyl esterase/lipase